MTTNRARTERGAPQRPPHHHDPDLERRRADMHASEGHAGSIPRGNQQAERENLGHRWREYERLLGH